MATMKALQLTKTGDTVSLTLTTLQKPTLKPGHILIKIKASAIQPSDIMNSKGLFPYTTYPRIPGRDFSGTIVEGPPSSIGKEVYGTSGNKQAFTIDGAQAEYMLVPEHAVAAKPKYLTFEQAAVLGVPFGTAGMALEKSGAKKGDVVLVLGANGAVGSAVVQLAKAKGCKVLEGSRQENADVNTSKDPALSAVDELTEGKGVDVVIDTVGNPGLTQAVVRKLGTGGCLVFIAAPKTGERGLAFDMLDFYRSERKIVGVNTLLHGVEEFAGELEVIAEMFDRGVLKAGREWEKVRLEEGVEAYERAGRKGAGKFVIVME